MTAWADIPLTDDIREAVAHAFEIDTTSPAERLYGGEESASYRVGDNVIRIGPEWRDTGELEWCYAVASHAGLTIPEVPSPMLTGEHRRVVRAEGRPITVWPFVQGSWADRDDPHHRAQAAQLLARLHRSLADAPVEARPIDTSPVVETPDLDDVELDQWWTGFVASHTRHQALHGDYYRGNMLVDDGRVTGLVDWDNAHIGPAIQELAWAAWEWTDASEQYDVERCAPFLAEYDAAGGPAPAPDPVTIAQVVRHRVRWEVSYGRAARARGVQHDADDLQYESDIIEAFHELRP